MLKTVTHKEVQRREQGKRLRTLLGMLMINATEFFEPLDFKARGVDIIRQIERGASGISPKMKREITEHYPAVNLEWLEKGYGEPLINGKKDDARYTYEYTPFYDYGIGDKHLSTMDKWTPSKDVNIHVPMFDCTCYIRVNSESMQPRIKRGDVIALRNSYDTNNIPFGKVFYLVTNEHHYLYRLRRSKKKGLITLAAENPEFDSFEIKVSEILELFIVTGQLSQL